MESGSKNSPSPHLSTQLSADEARRAARAQRLGLAEALAERWALAEGVDGGEDDNGGKGSLGEVVEVGVGCFLFLIFCWDSVGF